MAEQIIEFEAMEQAVSLFGSFDENVKLIENELVLNLKLWETSKMLIKRQEPCVQCLL